MTRRAACDPGRRVPGPDRALGPDDVPPERRQPCIEDPRPRRGIKPRFRRATR